jgi:hypothetical protein
MDYVQKVSNFFYYFFFKSKGGEAYTQIAHPDGVVIGYHFYITNTNIVVIIDRAWEKYMNF